MTDRHPGDYGRPSKLIGMTSRTPVEILRQSRTVASVGISTDPAKEAHRVPAALATIGFRIVPVHPTAEQILGQPAHPTLLAISSEIDIDVVQVFRPAAEIPAIARDAVTVGANALWLQIGLTSREGRAIAVAGGLDVVESQCMATLSAMHDIDHRSG